MEEQLFHSSSHMAAAVINRLTPADMHNPTPCSEWDVHELLNHMINELAWIKPLLEGKTITEVGSSLDGDLIKDDPAGSWLHYAKEAIEAADKTPAGNIAHLSYADKSVKDYVNEVGADIVIHAWDLAKAIGARYMIDEATARAVLEATKDLLPMARSGGYLGAELQVTESASAEEKVLAAYGRSSNWRASAV